MKRSPLSIDVISIMRARHVEAAIVMPLSTKARMISDVASTVWWENKETAERITIFGQQLTAFENKFQYTSVGRKVIAVRWLPQTIDSNQKYEKYFKPFDVEGIKAYTDLVEREYELRNLKPSDVESSPRLKFIVKTYCLTQSGYGALRSYFLQANYDFIMKTMYDVSKLIKPDAWSTTSSVID
jgi:hypothetical protein